MSWSEEHEQDLDVLLSFFVRVTKQTNEAHVWLITSEYGFPSWLSRGRWTMMMVSGYKVHQVYSQSKPPAQRLRGPGGGGQSCWMCLAAADGS
jgi:hypothetical protein